MSLPAFRPCTPRLGTLPPLPASIFWSAMTRRQRVTNFPSARRVL
jgi:hypothetical protein